MFDTDDKGWPVFPARFGGSPGKGVERGMLDVGGADGIRTKIKTLPDGSTVMLRTRNGFPEFTVTKRTIAAARVDFVETDYALRTYHSSHPFYTITGLQYLASITLDGGYTLSFALPPTDIEQGDTNYYPAEIEWTCDGLIPFYNFKPKLATLTGTETKVVMLSSNPLTESFSSASTDDGTFWLRFIPAKVLTVSVGGGQARILLKEPA